MTAIATSASTVNGGAIIATSDILVTGFRVARVTDLIAVHPAAPFGTGTHVGARIATGSPVVRITGDAMARVGDLCTCGHVIDPPGIVDIQDNT